MTQAACPGPRSNSPPAGRLGHAWHPSREVDRVRRDLGDFQTPRELVAAVLRCLGPVASRWTRVLEPTCGQGSFLKGLLEDPAPPRELIGIELQQSHVDASRAVARAGL